MTRTADRYPASSAQDGASPTAGPSEPERPGPARVAQLEAELELLRLELDRATRQTAEATERFALLLSAVPVGVVVLDARRRVSCCNPAAARILGGNPVGADWRGLARTLCGARRSGHGDWTTRQGRQVSVLAGAAETEAGGIVLLADVTETRTLEGLASRNERLSAMGRMAASLAHQVRTPLASALLYFTQCRTVSPQGRPLELLERGIDRLHDINRLVEDILVFARGAGPGERVRVADIFRDVHAAVAGILPVGAHLVIDGKNALLEIQGNRTALVAALTNLVRNAFEAAPNGVVTLKAELRNERIELTVADNGPGIAPAIRSRIFEPFFSTRSGGTGLGLAVAKTVAEAHGGEVILDSELDHGTTVGIELPTGRYPGLSDVVQQHLARAPQQVAV